MVTEYSNLISFQDLFSKSTDHFLEPFRHIVNPDITNGMHLPFKLSEKKRENKISPILKLAKPDNANEIVNIYLDIYKGTYPYKEMENIKEVKRMIEDSSYRFLLFKTPTNKIAGCFTYELDFNNRRGYMRGFNIKPKYQGIFDAVKAVVGSMIGVWNEYREKICHWYCENRTAHTKSQYLSIVCGINPIAFFPNKDVFFGKIESDIMHIAYNSKALSKYRINSCPNIISSVKPCFEYSKEKYDLGKCKISHPNISLNKTKIKQLKKKLEVRIENFSFNYEKIKFSSLNGSYFEFLHTPQVNNFEKVKYSVNSLEELYVYLKNFKKIIQEWNIRYSECFISAYKPSHQLLFYKAGFRPRGYIPSWNYNTPKKKFEDYIVFNFYKGGKLSNLHLIDEGIKLLNFIGESIE